MKQLFLGITAVLMLSWQSCTNEGNRYVDVNTGKALNLEKDSKTGRMIDKETGMPVSMYVDKRTGDTIDGRTGKVINGNIIKKGNRYVYRDEAEQNENVTASGDDIKIKRTDDEVKIKSGDYKKEVEKDGDITVKDGNKKVKIDGETGERKVKKDD